MTKSKQYLPFKFIVNGFNDSHLPFTIGNQLDFQNQYHYHSISFCPVLSHSLLFHSILSWWERPGAFERCFTQVGSSRAHKH